MLTYSSKANLVSEEVEAAYTILSVLEIVIFDEPEAVGSGERRKENPADSRDLPFAQTSLHVDDGLRALNIAEALTPDMQHLVSCLRQKTSNVDIRLARFVLKATIEWLRW